MSLTPQDFVSKWKRAAAREKQSVQEHFLDLCQLGRHLTPIEDDPSGTRFGFEMSAAKFGDGRGVPNQRPPEILPVKTSIMFSSIRYPAGLPRRAARKEEHGPAQ
jgi:hypothetical protein